MLMINIRKEEYFTYISLLVLTILAFFIIKSFIIPLIFSFILVYLFNPVYKKFYSIFKTHTLSSLIIIFVFLIIFILPISIIVVEFSGEISSIDNGKVSENLILLSTHINSKLNSNIDLIVVYNNFLADFDSYATDLIFKIPFFIFNIFIIVFFYYYFSRNYNDDINFIRSIIDINKFSYISKQIGELINGVIYGQIIVRFIQALIATIFFLAIGIDGAILFGVLTFFMAFIPIFGASLVWFPLAIIYFLSDDFLISILIIGIGFIVSTVDNFLLPFFISNKTNLGPVMTLISIIGGIQLLGFYGIVLGPFFLGLFFVFLEEVFSRMKSPVPLRAKRKNVWTEEERIRYRNLKTDFGRNEYKRILGLSSKPTSFSSNSNDNSLD